MRKYAIPKLAYVFVVAILLILSVGTTYAYFSATHTAVGGGKMHTIDISWRDANNRNALISSRFENSNAIEITFSDPEKNGIRRGEYNKISAVDIDDELIDIKLALANFGSAGAYCRIKIDASYVTKSGEQKTCSDGWVQLALNGTLITNSGWVFEDGYYYYKTGSALTTIASRTSISVADNLYLSTDASADIMGSQLTIMLTVEAVQNTHNAHTSVWA